MKNCFLLFVFCVYGCNTASQTKQPQQEVDTLTATFVTQKLCGLVPDSNTLILLINPSFCGSCTNAIRHFAENMAQLPCRKCLALSAPDSMLQKIAVSAPNTKLVYVPADTLARYNLLNPYSKLFEVQGTKILYHTPLIEEQLPQIWQALKARKRKCITE